MFIILEINGRSNYGVVRDQKIGESKRLYVFKAAERFRNIGHFACASVLRAFALIIVKK